MPPESRSVSGPRAAQPAEIVSPGICAPTRPCRPRPADPGAEVEEVAEAEAAEVAHPRRRIRPSLPPKPAAARPANPPAKTRERAQAEEGVAAAASDSAVAVDRSSTRGSTRSR